MNNKTNCAGTYRVSGYTRQDGTEVSSYMRTCGAKHEGDSMSDGANYLSDKEREYIDRKNGLEYLKKMFDYSVAGPILQTDNLNSNSISLNYNSMKYYMLSLSFNNLKEIYKENSYLKFGEIKDDKIKTFIQENCNIPNLNDNVDVVIPHIDSSLTKMVLDSVELQQAINKEYDRIKNDEYKNMHFDIVFNHTTDAHLTIGKAKLYNMRVVDDYICGTLVDYYDFDELNYKFKQKGIFNVIKSLAVTIANDIAYYQQETKNLHNYLILMPITYALKF